MTGLIYYVWKNKNQLQMKLFSWAKPKNEVIQNAEISQMTRPQLVERIENQRNVIRTQREKISDLRVEVDDLKQAGSLLIQDVLELKTVCMNNYDELPEELKNLIEQL
jgi:hypothetical protein